MNKVEIRMTDLDGNEFFFVFDGNQRYRNENGKLLIDIPGFGTAEMNYGLLGIYLAELLVRWVDLMTNKFIKVEVIRRPDQRPCVWVENDSKFFFCFDETCIDEFGKLKIFAKDEALTTTDDSKERIAE